MRNIHYWRFTLLWLILNALALFGQIKQTQEFVDKLAFNQSKLFFDQIVTIQHWNSNHGGVYAPTTENTPPNTHLNLPYPEIVRPDEQQLTLLTPIQIARQLSDLMYQKSGIQYHVTSLNPVNPKNKADIWETSSLELFEVGQMSNYAISQIDKTLFYRYMEPLLIEKSCVKCHRQQEKELGDMLGGLSVSIPANAMFTAREKRIQSLYLIHGFICMSGLLLLSVFQLTGQKTVKKLEKVKGKLRLAYIDSLTKLPNRRHYDIFLRKEWSRAQRNRYPLSMIMIDIDYFKAYNDNFGHPEGDRCLKTISSSLKKYFRRPGDLIARYGGEEFCVIAVCNSGQIKILAENLRKDIENCQIPHPKSKVSDVITISLGVSTLIPDEDNEPEQLLHYADRALYLAKENGRNQVKQYEI